MSRDRVRAKVLHWDGTGLCLYATRVDRGRFARLWRDEGDIAIQGIAMQPLGLHQTRGCV